ncbi:MAG: lyase family protein [archaeon]
MLYAKRVITIDKIDIFDTISPLDYRYYGRSDLLNELKGYLSENAMIRYQLKVEEALTKTLAEKGICPAKVAEDVSAAAMKVAASEVYAEEDRIKHNVRALVNCIRKRIPDSAKPYVHLTATSHDIICTAESLRYRDATSYVVIPRLLELEKGLIALARRERSTLQIGRTHGQHGEPITFGFAISEYVSRLGNRIQKIRDAAENLRGQVSGAVGAYNASSLFFDNPREFEKAVLKHLGLRPATHSTQIVEPEYMTDYVHSIISAFGVLANFADDMRHLQRSELSEVGELFGKKQVGSSTMPHKRNPINFENVKSLWKAIMPRICTLYLDQISEHQRDLTNSASSRFTPEIVAAFVASVKRLSRVVQAMVVDQASMLKNFEQNSGLIVAEPLYILLAYHNHPDAHEAVRELTLRSEKTGAGLYDLAIKDAHLKTYLKKFTHRQLDILSHPRKYTGISEKVVDEVCSHWEKELGV